MVTKCLFIRKVSYLNFFYGLIEFFSFFLQDFFQIFKNGQKKCPKMDFPK
jgi:hypothetical protein